MGPKLIVDDSVVDELKATPDCARVIRITFLLLEFISPTFAAA